MPRGQTGCGKLIVVAGQILQLAELLRQGRWQMAGGWVDGADLSKNGGLARHLAGERITFPFMREL